MKKTNIRTVTVLSAAALLFSATPSMVQASVYCEGLSYMDGSADYEVNRYDNRPCQVTVYFARPTRDGVAWDFDYEFNSAEPCAESDFKEWFYYEIYLGSMDVVEETDSGLTIYKSWFGVNPGKYQFTSDGELDGIITLTQDGLSPIGVEEDTSVEVTDSSTAIFVIYEQYADDYLDEFVTFAQDRIELRNSTNASVEESTEEGSSMEQWADENAQSQNSGTLVDADGNPVGSVDGTDGTDSSATVQGMVAEDGTGDKINEDADIAESPNTEENGTEDGTEYYDQDAGDKIEIPIWAIVIAGIFIVLVLFIFARILARIMHRS